MRSAIGLLFLLAAGILAGPSSACRAEMVFPVTGTLDGFSGNAVHVRWKNYQYFINVSAIYPDTLERIKKMKPDSSITVWAPTSAIQVRKILTQKPLTDDDEEEAVKQAQVTPLVGFYQWHQIKIVQ